MSDHELTRIKVLELSSAAGFILAAVQLIAGDVKEAMLIEAEDTHERWEIKGIAFVPAEALKTGLRGLSLLPVDQGAVLRVGQIFTSLPLQT